MPIHFFTGKKKSSCKDRQAAFIVPDDGDGSADDIDKREGVENNDDVETGPLTYSIGTGHEPVASDKSSEMESKLDNSMAGLLRQRERESEQRSSNRQRGLQSGIVSFRVKEGMLSIENRNIGRRESGASEKEVGAVEQDTPRFYWFLDPKIAKEYKAFTREYFDLTTLLAICVLGFAFHLPRNYFFITFSASPYLCTAFILEVVASVGLILFAVVMITRRLGAKKNGKGTSAWTSFVDRIASHPYFDHLEDFISIVTTICFGLVFTARVAGGPCQKSQSIWHTETCNPGDTCGLIPIEDALLLYVIPLTIQICFRGIDFQTVLLSWTISTAFVLWAVISHKFWRNIWFLVLSLFFLVIIEESERFMRLSYIQRLQLLLAEQKTRELERTRAANELHQLETKHKAEISRRVKQRDIELVQNLYSLSQLEAHNYKIWFQLIQLDRYEGVVDRVQEYIDRFPHLASVKDADGRFAVDVARRNVKKILQSVMLWHGRYRLLDKRPEHTSATCYVYKAVDELMLDDSGQPMRVAIKLMRRKDQFIREVEARKKGFSTEYVVNIITTYPFMGNNRNLSFAFTEAGTMAGSSPAAAATVPSALKRANMKSTRFVGHFRNSTEEMPPVGPDSLLRTLDDYPDVVDIENDEDDKQTLDEIPTHEIGGRRESQSSLIGRRSISGELTKAQAEKFFCIVMPQADRNMFVALKQERWAGRNMDMVRHAFGQLVKCVDHVHSRNVIHGDLKPLNIVRIGGHWRLIDLDASCAVGLEPVGHKSSSAYIPPEAVYTDTDNNTVCVRTPFGTSANSAAGVEPLIAHATFDIWSLGCIFYQLCTADVRPLFGGGLEDNLTEDRTEEDNLWTLAEWTVEKKEKKLSRVHDPLARNLLSQMLQKDPKLRPTLARILAHPFLSARKVARLVGEKAEYDVFISYRAASDEQHAEVLYDLLTAKGVKVWWDKRCLLPGEDWKEGFCAGLVNSRSFICIMSRGAINHKTKVRQNFSKLTEDSPCDHVFLEHRLAVELQGLGLIEKIFPVMIGDYNISNGTYGNYIKDGCFPNAPFTCVKAVEADLLSLMESQALGTPLEFNKSVATVLQKIVSCQGCFIEGERDQAFNKAVDSICSMLHIDGSITPLDDAEREQRTKLELNAKQLLAAGLGAPSRHNSARRRSF